MSKICEVTGKKVMFGNNVSFSINKTKRRFDANISKKKFYIPEEDKWVTLNVSSKGIKIINKKGVSAALKDARAKGFVK
ncbi:50S ribosomal protein L28 [Croceitalea sp. MTPC9]|uniref:50S ribosomal protein L28 n=1 Tax=unclassified Croceitalea TaxID=2632280 RepID=UPI002B375F10|nr:50S ribosomal protein L28 [Croceitalea sp. MTPC6]GMN17926.1 50S ribosomal protein L28 [Croceitalea sp. MTPC9]